MEQEWAARLGRMEELKKRSERTLKELEGQMESFTQLIEDMEVLSDYYDSEAWVEDCAKSLKAAKPEVGADSRFQEELCSLLMRYDRFLNQLVSTLGDEERDG